jgi:hypothetical protein
MSIQHRLTAPLFRCDEDGWTVVYPNGPMGSGYFVDDAATEQRMRSSLMWLVHGCGVISWVGAVILMGFYGAIAEWPAAAWAVAITAFAVFSLLYRAAATVLTIGMEPAELRMDVIDALKRQAEALPAWYLWLMLVMAPPMLAVTVFWLIADPAPINYAIAGVGNVVLAVGAIQATHGLTN